MLRSVERSVNAGWNGQPPGSSYWGIFGSPAVGPRYTPTRRSALRLPGLPEEPLVSPQSRTQGRGPPGVFPADF